MTIAIIFLTSVFTFAPVFDAQIHQERVIPLPDVYFSIQDWLTSNMNEGERIMFLPTDSFSAVLGVVDTFGAASGYALRPTKDYVDFTYNQLIKSGTYNLGSLLAPASVKYIILATPNASTLSSGTSAVGSPLHPQWDLQGDPRYLENTVIQGDPNKIAAILDVQKDLELVHHAEDFLVYENKVYLPKISVFTDATYIVGSNHVPSLLDSIPGFEIDRVLPILAQDNIGLPDDLSNAVTSFTFYNSDINDYFGLLSAAEYGINLVPLGSTQGWTQCDTNETLATYNDYFIETHAARSLNASFIVDVSGMYYLWLETLFSRSGSKLSILVDNSTIAEVITSDESKASGFHWVPIDPTLLSPGNHSATILTTDGSNAVGQLAIVPASDQQNIFAKIASTVSTKQQLYLFDQYSSNQTRLIVLPQGQYWIAVSVPETVKIDQSMGIINIDEAMKFVLTREQFKPARNSPKWDFDNANYHFYTALGGRVSITFNGSARVWAYIAYNSTLSQMGENVPYVFPSVENQTFYFDFPPNTIFQPIINAYNPDIVGQNVTNDLKEIIIEHEIGGKYANVSIDGLNIASSQSDVSDGWGRYGPVQLGSTSHNMTISNGIKGGTIAIYNTDHIAKTFGTKTDVSFEVEKASETRYNAKLSSNNSLFLVLSESYHANWNAYLGDQRLVHFIAFSFANGFYLNKTGTEIMNIEVEYVPPLLNQVYVGQQVMFGTIILMLVFSPTLRRLHKKLRSRKTGIKKSKPYEVQR